MLIPDQRTIVAELDPCPVMLHILVTGDFQYNPQMEAGIFLPAQMNSAVSQIHLKDLMLNLFLLVYTYMK